MTDTTTTEAELVPEATAGPGVEREQPSTPADKPGAEAAKYRRQLRDTETERDALRERVHTLQRAEVEQLAAHLAKPAALWASGTTLDDLLDDAGNVDAAKVSEAAKTAADTLGLARIPGTPRPDPGQGGSGGAPTVNRWADAMKMP